MTDYNQATNFRECMIENFSNVFLGQGHFEEPVTWYDSDTATGRPITVSDVSANGQLEQDQHSRRTGRAVHFLVTNDAVLGTTEPKTGNRIVRADGTSWGFRHIVGSDVAGWVLEFVGGQMDRAGMGRGSHL